MLKKVTVLGLLVALAGGSVVSGAEDLVLGFRGRSKYQVVIPDSMANGTVSNSVLRAADLLTNTFGANGITLDVKPESALDATRPGIFLGATTFAAANGVDADKLSGWTYLHKVVGSNVVIVGNDRPDDLVGKRSTIRKDVTLPYEGTLFGAAEFVYRYAGARFLAPGKNGTAFVPTSIIHIPADLNTNRSPFFSEHDWRESPELFNTANHCLKFQRIWSRWGHQHPSAVPIDEYGKDHPEYFILAGGVRQPELSRQDGQLCFSHPEVRELIYKHILDRCDEGFDIVEVGQADGFRPCGCSKCAELYGITPDSMPTTGLYSSAWGEKLWIMHRDMALRLLKDRPGKKIMISAYSVTAPPPRTFNEFPTNTIIEMMNSSEESFDAWKAIKVPGGFAAYLYNWGTLQLKGMTVAQIAAQNRRLVDNNVGIVQVNGRPRSGESGLQGPNIYVYLRLGIDPFTKSADELFSEYLQAAFRESENPMRRFFVSFQKRVSLLEVMREYTSKVDRDPFFILSTIYTPDLINSMEADLAAAEQQAQLPEVKHRLDIVRYEFEFLRHIVLVLNAYRNHQAMNDAPSLNQLLNAVDARNRFIASVVNGDGKYPGGRNPAYFKLTEQSLKYAEPFLDRAPFNWDTAQLRAAPERLLRRDPTLAAARVECAPTLEAPTWDAIAAQALNPVDMAVTTLQAATTFKIVHDGKHLYVRVSGDQPADRMTFTSRGRDAELWLQESIVINVSPLADKSRYYYLAYEPVPGSYNDAAHGFITDILHPRYGWNDESWNGTWSFETRLVPGKGKWESMAVIPFETLGVAAPKPGETWFINVGRVHFFDTPEKKNQRELSAWTGVMNPSRVPGDASFGKVTFQ